MKMNHRMMDRKNGLGSWLRVAGTALEGSEITFPSPEIQP